MKFFRKSLLPEQNSHFLRIGLLAKNFGIIYAASQQEYIQNIHPSLFYEEINRLESSREDNTIDEKYLAWYEKLISHLPEESKMKCLIGLLCVSISQSYRANFSDVSKELGFYYQEINDMSIIQRIKMVNTLKSKVQFDRWPVDLKNKLESHFKSPIHGLNLNSLSDEIDVWVQNLGVIILHNQLGNTLNEKTTEIKKPKI